MNRFALRALSLLVFVHFAALAGAKAPDEGWIDLSADAAFAENWHGFQKSEIPPEWTLTDGVISLEGSGGDLVTRQKFGDFELRFEWKIVPGGNSGVIYRATEGSDAPWHTGPEYQVLDPEYPGRNPLHGPASLYGVYAAPADAAKPAGEWNTARILVEGDRVEHWANGRQVVSADLSTDEWARRVAASKFSKYPGFAKARSGHLVLQDHDHRVWYRKVHVRPIVAESTASKDTHRLLFVTQSAGFRHPTVTRKAHELSHSEQVLQRLGIESGDFRVDCTQDVAADFTPELLANYDVVAFYSTGDLPIPEETREWFLEEWLAEQGHGVIGFHSAADTYHNYEPFWDMLGGTFDGHPWSSQTAVVLQLHSADHPASRAWGVAGARIPITDEIYQFRHWQPEKVRVLMSLDMQQTELKRPWHVPILWVKQYGEGRVMHMSLGHREDVWTNPTYQESVVGGIRWLLGLEPGDATPNPELSAAEEQSARAAFDASGQELPKKERRRLARTATGG